LRRLPPCRRLHYFPLFHGGITYVPKPVGRMLCGEKSKKVKNRNIEYYNIVRKCSHVRENTCRLANLFKSWRIFISAEKNFKFIFLNCRKVAAYIAHA
jgi:hypothetical protein